MTSQLSQQENILYQDDTVQVYRDKIIIQAYYFPIPAAKTIDMVDVQAVHLRDNVDGQTWGTTPGHMDTWFALDNNRHLKKQYLEIVIRDSDVKAAFSPNDPHKVMAIIQTNSALLKAQKQLKEKNLQVKEQVHYTTEFPQQQIIHEKITQVIEQPLLKQPLPPPKPLEPISPNIETKVVVESPPKKGLGESIKEKINEKLEGLKNVKDTLKQKYEEGKENAYVSPDNRIDVAKENLNQGWQETKANTGEAYIQAGQSMQKKGAQMQYDAWKKS